MTDALPPLSGEPSFSGNLASEVAKRRTFAIISHPDAGKTTLTEKLLLYSGMLRTAGMVRGRKGSKAASSDWMALEQERGISITASAMQFNYKNSTINVLDTPGHQDFSEDTYRTLTAADSAIMVIDSVKGVETQTRKLFAVCRMRKIPVLTFMNKLDLAGQDPWSLMEEVEAVLQIKAAPLNWPIGSGKDFCGVANCKTGEITLFNKSAAGGAKIAQARTLSTEQALSEGVLPRDLAEKLAYELELLREAGNEFSREAFLKGEVTPVFFGSAMTNFGVEPFFDSFTELAPAPYARPVKLAGDIESQIDPVETPFSAFVFKVQANMNPKHRDSMAFMRVCSGVFERDLVIKHHRLGKELRLSRSHSMLGGDRNTIDQAFPGDIVGVINPGTFAIGDTVSLTGGFEFYPMPSFPSEVFAVVRPNDVSKRKAFDKGIKQLSDEGAIQVFTPLDSSSSDVYVAAVGRLQFEVLQYRLKDEYGVDARLENLPFECSAWLVGDPRTFMKSSTSLVARDAAGRCMVLFRSTWEKKYAGEKNPGHELREFA